MMQNLRKLNNWLKTHSVLSILGDLGLVALVYLLGQLAVSTVIRAGGINHLSELYARPSLLVAAYVIGGIVSLIGILAVLKFRRTSLSDVALNKPKIADLGYGVLGFGAYFLVVRVVLILVSIAFPSINLSQQQDIGLSNITSGLLPAAFLGLAILPPLSEELLFRGFLFTRLQKHKLSLPLAAVIVSLVFGAMHGQWNVSIDTFVLSMTMIYTMRYRKSLWVTITMHALKNTIAFYALFILKIHS